MPVTPNTLLDLPARIGQRRETVRWQVLDQELNPIGDLDVERQAGAAVVNDTRSAVKRKVRSVTIRDSQDVNLFTDRIAPVWVLEDGTEWDLGVFMFPKVSDVLAASGRSRLGATLFDQGFILDQPTDRTVGISEGGSVYDTIVDIVDRLGFDEQRRVIDRSNAAVADPVGWPAGSQTWGQVLGDLTAMAGAFSPYFDNAGILRVRRVVPVDELSNDDAVTYDLGPSSRVVRDSVVISDNLLSAPNRWVVINTGANEGEIVGVADVDPQAPHSFERRGFRIVEVIRMQGIESTQAAQLAAEGRARESFHSFDEIRFDSAADPRHDTFDLVLFDQQLCREVRWELPLDAGSVMSHEIRVVA